MSRYDELVNLIPEDSKDLILPMLDEVLFLEEQLVSLKKLPFIQVNPKNTMQQRSTPAAKQYDGIKLKAFIDKIVALGATNFTVNVIGNFYCNTSSQASDSKYYFFVYEYNGTGDITIDFSECDIVLPANNFMYVKNVRVKNCYVRYSRSTPTVFKGDGAKFIDCTVRGVFNGSNTSTCFSGDGIHCVGCYISVEQTGGNVYGFDVTESVIDRCVVHIKSNFSAYGVRAIETSQVTNSRFSALSTNTGGSNSGTGGIGGGNFTNCIFIGRGASVGYGFVQSDGNMVNSFNCTYRGYTASATGNGIGYRANNSDTNGVFLMRYRLV